MIPHEAVESAAKALSDDWDEEGEHTRVALLKDARAALEAAAKHMLAEAWDEGADAECYSAPHEQLVNPYRSRA